MKDKEDFQDLENRLSSLSPASASDPFLTRLKNIASNNTEVIVQKNFSEQSLWIWTSVAAIAATMLIGIYVWNSKPNDTVPKNGSNHSVANRDSQDILTERLVSKPNLLSFRLQQKQGKKLSDILNTQAITLLPDCPLDFGDLH